MKLNQLRYFSVLAEELNFNRAAQRLNMSQPPLSRQIQQLEDDLGVRLFDRTTRGVELTEIGKSFYADALGILADVDRCRDNLVRASRGEIGRLDIGIFGSGILHHIPQFIMEFRQRFPGVRISLYEQTKSEQVDALREHRITVGFNRRVSLQPDITIETVYKEPLCIALPSSHPLAAAKQLAISDIVAEPLILYPSNTRPSFADTVVALIEEAGGQAKIEQEVPNVVTAIALVASGFGICITPLAARSLKLPGVVFRSLKSKRPIFVEQVVLYRTDDRSPILAAFLDVVRHYRPESMADI